MLSPRRKAALIAFAGFIVLGALSIHASPMSASNLQARLQSDAQAALVRVRADSWADVSMNGQVATVTGRAPSREARDRALTAVSRAAWAGGVVAGGVTRVIDETHLASQDDEFGLRADKVRGRLIVRGQAPDADAEARLRDLVAELSPGGAVVELTLAPGSAPEGWERAARLLLQELARMDNGAGMIRRDRLAITGLAPNAPTVNAIRAAFSVPPGDFRTAALVRTDGGGFDVAVRDARLCEMLAASALGADALSFAPGTSRFTSGSRSQAAASRAGRAFAACEDVAMSVAVRAEADADTAEGLALSQAETVIAAMVAGGADAARLSALALPSDAPEQLRFLATSVGPDGEPLAAETDDDQDLDDETDGADAAQTQGI
ncbi:hypothetical protein L2D00_01510 [Hyphomonadaceae bacterium BL14]|nr:hypothetical protein L2D00_01510 [Hyphomonadaceae bacterium BL14]